MSTLLAMLQSKQKELAAKKIRDNTTKLPNGQSRWRILPHFSGDEAQQFWHDFGKHFVKDFSGEVEAVYLCTSKTYGRECPVCAAITRGEVSVKDENAKNLISGAKAAQRYLVNAVRKNDKTGSYDPEVVILELPTGAFDDVLSSAALYANDDINIVSLKEGFDIVFTREGTGLKTKYKASLAPKSTAIDPSYLSKATNLEQYVNQEYEEGKTKALAALQNLSGSATPVLPAALTRKAAAPAAVAEVLPAAAPSASTTPTVSAPDADDSLDVDLSDIDLSDLDSIE